jgi:hypothetical protein
VITHACVHHRRSAGLPGQRAAWQGDHAVCGRRGASMARHIACVRVANGTDKLRCDKRETDWPDSEGGTCSLSWPTFRFYRFRRRRLARRERRARSIALPESLVHCMDNGSIHTRTVPIENLLLHKIGPGHSQRLEHTFIIDIQTQALSLASFELQVNSQRMLDSFPHRS